MKSLNLLGKEGNMNLINIRDLFHNQKQYTDKQVTIGGWVRSNRKSKAFGFLVVNDGTFFEPVQVVYGDGLVNFEDIGKVNVGAALIVTGTMVETPDAKQPFEIQAAKVEIEGASAPEYPLQKKGTVLNTCVQLRICGRGQIHLKQCFAYVPLQHMQFISFFRSGILYMCTRQLLLGAIVRVRGKCFR